MLDLYDELTRIVDALNEKKIDYAVCGGIAMAIWSLPRATVDIDILVRESDLLRIEEVVAPLGYVVKAMPMTFSKGAMKIRRISNRSRNRNDPTSTSSALH